MVTYAFSRRTRLCIAISGIATTVVAMIATSSWWNAPRDSAEVRAMIDRQLDRDSERPTAEQLADLKLIQEQPYTNAGRQAGDRIRAALEKPENEPLALEAVRTLIRLHEADDHGTAYGNLMFYLRCRMGLRGEGIVIDGPYLKALAYFEMNLIEDDLSGKRDIKKLGELTRSGATIPYLVAHPADPLRHRALALVMPYVNVSKFGARPDVDSAELFADDHLILRQVSYAWKLLLALGVLHDHMDYAAAEKLLGPPQHKYQDGAIVHWVIPVHHRKSYYLYGEVKDGIVEKLRFH